MATKTRPNRAPRHKHLNDALYERKGGRHYSPITDYNRSKEKQRERKDQTTEE